MADRLSVNPNRMELLKLRRRMKIARRGHKLLKDKFDELMKRFMALVKEVRDLRREVEGDLGEAHKLFALARSQTATFQLDESLSFPGGTVDVSVKEINLMSVIVPEFELSAEGGYDCYGLGLTPSIYDDSLRKFRDLLPRLVELAEKEERVRNLAIEIEKTRRRVNALEYVLIPQLEETIRYITMKLDEMERSNLTQLMKIKEMVAETN
ncbi:MAG: V-type ATP synthase subunit D [Actinobacteria bacterium]|nr:V-type ATP synthase subunit D [Actinomycetota bacterium]MBU4180011.1 V-type ATP synthase subunit D [Actinomycetota bacterium]MBU4217581.1 V-type ATP synthase subunit D [Actinomycetota bacterium]MBU4358092.1 V-type ATP synthase subunit D [Actinomycetota bacterium]MBU4391619.1 V-type ATP synthase subunit D [Actinomycetota bacterium]